MLIPPKATAPDVRAKEREGEDRKAAYSAPVPPVNSVSADRTASAAAGRQAEKSALTAENRHTLPHTPSMSPAARATARGKTERREASEALAGAEGKDADDAGEETDGEADEKADEAAGEATETEADKATDGESGEEAECAREADEKADGEADREAEDEADEKAYGHVCGRPTRVLRGILSPTVREICLPFLRRGRENSHPLIRAAASCMTYSKTPSFTLWRRPAPTPAIRKAGPQRLDISTSRSALSRSSSPAR